MESVEGMGVGGHAVVVLTAHGELKSELGRRLL